MTRKYFASALALSLLIFSASAQTAEKSHGLSAFGDLKYGADFKHFDYVNPNAPKGGAMRLRGIDSFDNLNGFILKGVPPDALSLIHATLMERATDEPDALYGYVAKTVELASDKSWIVFELRPEATFNDGTRITANDVVFTFNILVEKGHPQYRIIFAGVKDVEALTPARIKFTFKEQGNRDLPLQLATLPLLSKSFYIKTPFEKTTLNPPLGAGPYKVEKDSASKSTH